MNLQHAQCVFSLGPWVSWLTAEIFMDISEHEVGLCLGPTEPSSLSSGMLAVYICVDVCVCENLSLLSAQ